MDPRLAFEAEDGCVLLACDWAQIELRLLAHLSADASLIRLFNDPHCPDFFRALAAEWLALPLDQVRAEDRTNAKRIAYAVIYGIGPVNLAEHLGVTQDKAKAFMASFLRRYPGVEMFQRATVAQCRKYGYVTTIMKRRRAYPDIKAKDMRVKSHAERSAINFAIQGSAADICKAAMVRAMGTLAEERFVLCFCVGSVVHGKVHIPHCPRESKGLRASLVLQIHDELVLTVREEDVGAVVGVVAEAMTRVIALKVPLVVATKVGKTWADLELHTP